MKYTTEIHNALKSKNYCIYDILGIYSTALHLQGKNDLLRYLLNRLPQTLMNCLILCCMQHQEYNNIL